MTPKALRAAEPRCDEFMRDPLPHTACFEYRANVNLPGNTCSWSRVPLVLGSRSLLFDLAHADMAWYYPALQEGTHYVGFAALDALPAKFAAAMADPVRCQVMTDNANRFCSAFAMSNHAAQYWKHLLEHADEANGA